METKRRRSSLGGAEDFFTASMRFLESRLGSAFHISGNKNVIAKPENEDTDTNSTTCKCRKKKKNPFRILSKSKSKENCGTGCTGQREKKNLKKKFKNKRCKSKPKDSEETQSKEIQEDVDELSKESKQESDDVLLADDDCSSYDDTLYDDTDEWDDIIEEDEPDYWWSPDGQGTTGSGCKSDTDNSPKHKDKSDLHMEDLKYPVVYEGNMEETRTKKLKKERETFQSNYFPPPYVLKKSSALVTMKPRTWDIILNNLRIAMETDNFFTCDQFLGNDICSHINSEMMELKNQGHFEKSEERPAGFGRSLFLERPSSQYGHVDCLVSLVYNLAHSYRHDWKYITVELCYCKPNEGPQEIFEFGEKSHKSAMKILYFPNTTQTLPRTYTNTKFPRLRLTTSGGAFDVDLQFDRLVAFWGDTIEHEIFTGYLETFLVVIWLFR